MKKLILFLQNGALTTRFGSSHDLFPFRLIRGVTNHLRTGMIIQVDQVVTSRVNFTPWYRDEKPSFPDLFSAKLYPIINLSAPNMNQPKHFNPMDSKEFLLNLITCWIIQRSLHPAPLRSLYLLVRCLEKVNQILPNRGQWWWWIPWDPNP